MTYVELEKISFQHPVVLYDGFCFLCDHTIKYLIEKDHDQKLRYHTLDSENEKPSTVKLLYNGKEFEQSDVMVIASKLISNPGFLLGSLKFIPKVIRDLGYRIVAANRYRLLGRSDTCLLPVADNRHLFLHLNDSSE